MTSRPHRRPRWWPHLSAVAVAAACALWTTSAAGLSVEPAERLMVTAPPTLTIDRGHVTIPVTLESAGSTTATRTTLRVWGPGYGTVRSRTVVVGPVRPGNARRIVVRAPARATSFRQPVYLSASSPDVYSASQTILVEPVPDASMDATGVALSGLAGMSRGSRAVW